MVKKTIAILYGGKSGEHEVSCRSAASVLSHLDEKRFAPVCIGIDKDGIWYLQAKKRKAEVVNDEMLSLEREGGNIVSIVPGKGLYRGGEPLNVDFVFPVLHGTFGEDGTIQGCLELADVPYAGAGTLASALGMDKEITKRVWLQHSLPVVPFVVEKKVNLFAGGTYSVEAVDALYRKVTDKFGDLLFCKPVCSGSSVGVSRVHSAEQFLPAIKEAFLFDTRVIIEPAVAAREIECSVVGNDEVTAYPPGEVVPSHDFYSYNAKYVDENGAKLCIPASLPQDQQAEVMRIARNAYSAVGATGFARIDFFIMKENDNIVLNEINTIPGFTNISMFSRMCEADGVSYSELLAKIIELGFDRFERTRELIYTYREKPSYQ